jgi:hypothetical protein
LAKKREGIEKRRRERVKREKEESDREERKIKWRRGERTGHLAQEVTREAGHPSLA